MPKKNKCRLDSDRVLTPYPKGTMSESLVEFTSSLAPLRLPPKKAGVLAALNKKKLIIGTRGSQLALWQARHAAEILKQHYPDLAIELKKIVTTGDKILDTPLAKIGGKALFTKELETAMLAGEIDLAVHSLKDMPAELPAGLVLAAVTKREHPGDAFISPKYRTVDSLPAGARVGTSSLRRKAQLLNYRADLEITDLRGNLDTRLNKLTGGENLDAILLAVSGLNRLGWQQHITQILPMDIFLPAAGQGALAIEARADDAQILEIIRVLHDETTHAAVTAERAFLAQIGGGCQIPVGAHARVTEEAGPVLTLAAAILAPDGTKIVKEKMTGQPQDAVSLGQHLAQKLLDGGGREILAKLNES